MRQAMHHKRRITSQHLIHHWKTWHLVLDTLCFSTSISRTGLALRTWIICLLCGGFFPRLQQSCSVQFMRQIHPFCVEVMIGILSAPILHKSYLGDEFRICDQLEPPFSLAHTFDQPDKYTFVHFSKNREKPKWYKYCSSLALLSLLQSNVGLFKKKSILFLIRICEFVFIQKNYLRFFCNCFHNVWGQQNCQIRH